MTFIFKNTATCVGKYSLKKIRDDYYGISMISSDGNEKPIEDGDGNALIVNEGGSEKVIDAIVHGWKYVDLREYQV